MQHVVHTLTNGNSYQKYTSSVHVFDYVIFKINMFLNMAFACLHITNTLKLEDNV